MKVHAHKKRGFTLIELSVVLVILGLIVGTLAPLMMSMMKRDKIKNAKEVVSRAKDEIIGFAMTNNGTLPSSVYELGHFRDPWGQELYLIVAQDLQTTSNNGTNACNATSTSLSLLIYEHSSTGTCNNSTTINNIAFIIGSKGPNFNRQAGPVVGNSVISFDYGCIGDQFPNDGTSQSFFDDITEYVTLNELKGKVCN